MGKLILTIVGLGLESFLWVNLLGADNPYRQKLGWKHYTRRPSSAFRDSLYLYTVICILLILISMNS